MGIIIKKKHFNKIQFPVCFNCKKQHTTKHMTCIDNDEEKVLVSIIKMHKHIYKSKKKEKRMKNGMKKITWLPFKIRTI